LNTKAIIPQISAIILLALFLLGNTPRLWLHDAFANHTGCAKFFEETKEGAKSSSVQRVHCECNDIVIESPFAAADGLLLIFEPVSYSGFSVPDTTTPFFCLTRIMTLRGPPAFA